MSDIVALRSAIIAKLKNDITTPVFRQVAAKTVLPYVRVSPIASRRRDMSVSGLAFATTIRLYVETARGSGDEAWAIADEVLRCLDAVRFDLSPHAMTDMFVVNIASIIDIALEQQSIALDLSTTICLGDIS